MSAAIVRSPSRERRLIRRRQFLSATGSACAAVALASCAEQADGPLASTRIGKGPVTITIWVQDFGPMIAGIRRAAQEYAKGEPEVSISVQVVPYNDLRAKVIPAVAAGSEADIINAYNSWFVAADINRMFLPLDEYVGDREKVSRIVFPNALEATATPGGRIYYMPYLSGMNVSSTTINVDDFKKKGIDHRTLRSWEDMLSAAKELTVVKNGHMVRSGISPLGQFFNLLQAWIWQQGGEFYDRAKGEWNLSTDHGRMAIQRLSDLFWKDRVCDFALLDGTSDDFLRRRISANVAGVYQVSNLEAADPTLHLDGIMTPPLAGGHSSLFGGEIAVMTLSKRLRHDARKRRHCVALMRAMLSADALLSMTDVYSGTMASKDLYRDSRVEKTRFGPLSQRMASQLWPKIRFTRARVSDTTDAETEIERGIRKEISLKEALANAEKYLNEKEQLAYQRQR